MTRAELTEKLLGIKREKGWTWKYICDQIGGMSPVLITGAVLGQMKMTKPQAAKAAEMFGLGKSEQALLNEVPNRGSPMPPTDPLIYRFYELVMVNGPALKVLIEEEFGDGIMSAIDFDLQMERQPDPKGDRVRIAMSGKFLPYKYYGSTGNAQAYGYKAIRHSPFALMSAVLARQMELSARRPMPAAMAVEAVVGPAVASADRGAPERLAVDRADDAAGDRTDRACDHETNARAGRRADHVGLRARGGRSNRGENGRCQNDVPHGATPITRYERASYHAIAFHKVDAR